MWRCVFCAHKPYFLIPDHILTSFVPLFIYEFTATMVVLLGLTITRRNFASTLPYGLIMLPIYVGHVIWQFPRVATYLMYPCNYAYSQIDHSNVCIYICIIHCLLCINSVVVAFSYIIWMWCNSYNYSHLTHIIVMSPLSSINSELKRAQTTYWLNEFNYIATASIHSYTT